MALFEWDERNVEHVAEHQVSTMEAEQTIVNDPLDLDVQHDEGEERIVQLGATNVGLILIVVSTWRGTSIRLVTAIDAPRAMRLNYLRHRGRFHG